MSTELDLRFGAKEAKRRLAAAKQGAAMTMEATTRMKGCVQCGVPIAVTDFFCSRDCEEQAGYDYRSEQEAERFAGSATLKVGQRVHWDDPEGLTSGLGVITKVQGEDDGDADEDTVITLAMDDGGEVEAVPHELTDAQPEPVETAAALGRFKVYNAEGQQVATADTQRDAEREQALFGALEAVAPYSFLLPTEVADGLRAALILAAGE